MPSDDDRTQSHTVLTEDMEFDRKSTGKVISLQLCQVIYVEENGH
jgi:hypothetical protein